MPPIERIWSVQMLNDFLRIIAELARPQADSRLRVLTGRVGVEAEAAYLYTKRHSYQSPSSFETAQRILSHAGALEPGQAGRKTQSSRRWVDPTFVITQAHVDAYYVDRVQRVRARRDRRAR